MQKILALCAVLGVLTFAGCSSPEEVKSVAWYKQKENRAALDAKIAWCKENAAKAGNDQNCRNAVDALATLGSFEKVKEPAVPTF